MIVADDLFAGAGGWDVALDQMGYEAMGYEFDKAACATRDAAGLITQPGDVRAADPTQTWWPGLIASPPCQTFSAAGKGSGRADLARVLDAVLKCDLRAGFADERTSLILEPLRWIVSRYAVERPYRWIAFEQVPHALPVWAAYAEVLEGLGYSAWTGIMYAEQYGVPQTRKRAILMADLDREVRTPWATHSRYYPRTPAKQDPNTYKWVSMGEALGWTVGGVMVSNYGTGGDASKRGQRTTDQPAPTVTSKFDRNVVYRSSTMANSPRRPLTAPAPAIAFGNDAASAGWESEHGAREAPGFIRVTAEEAAVLQSFPKDYPWQGNKGQVFQQIGNAIPPLMAKAILTCLVS